VSATHPAAPVARPTRLGARELLRASRPVSWINTGLPFLAAAWDTARALDPAVILGTLYFLGPYNLLLYGVNDRFDYASDVRNPRKQSLEGGLVGPADGRRLWGAVLVTNVPFLLALAWLGGPVVAAALGLTVAVALAYSAPPLRTKERPVLDSVTSALHFVLPAVCGFLVAGRAPSELPWAILAGFMAWGIASHAIGAIQDVAYDRAAGIGSIATALGARATAGVALAGYVVAVAVAVTVEAPWGPVAALALASYVLLPLMVLARPDEAQARRAWRSFMQLNIPVGFVLAQLLLRSWGVTAYGPWELAIGVATATAGWMLANTLLIRWSASRGEAAQGTGRPALPPLTVLVPCRDEAPRLGPCLDALAGQAYPGELRVLVVDDGSADGSPELAAARLAPLGDRGRVIRAPRPPDAWAGKGWAVATGMREAATELVLAVDADTVLEPGAAERLVRAQLATGAGMVSGVTRYAMPTAGERLAMPGYPMLLFGLVPAWLSALRRGRPAALAFAYGPLVLVRRAAYLRTGGHAAVPGSHREDVDLASTFARSGAGVALVHAAPLATTRHYADAAAVLASWRRILPGYAGGSVAVVLTLLVAELAGWILPLALPLAALAVAPDRLPASLVPLAILVAWRLALAATQRQPPVTVVLHPVTALLTIGAQLVALGDLVRGRAPAWRGRTMPDAQPVRTGARPVAAAEGTDR
jgi:4-hydroxybenzoate polyprenyltransferase